MTLCIREARTVCSQVGDVNPIVYKDWYGWASDGLCDYRAALFPVDVNVQRWKVAFFFFRCELNIRVKSVHVVQKLVGFS